MTTTAKPAQRATPAVEQFVEDVRNGIIDDSVDACPQHELFGPPTRSERAKKDTPDVTLDVHPALARLGPE